MERGKVRKRCRNGESSWMILKGDLSAAAAEEDRQQRNQQKVLLWKYGREI